MRLEILLYSLLFILIGLVLVSLFLVWKWFDARERLKVVREVTREQTIHAIRRAHNKCRILLYISLLLALAYVPIPFILQDFFGRGDTVANHFINRGAHAFRVALVA